MRKCPSRPASTLALARPTPGSRQSAWLGFLPLPLALILAGCQGSESLTTYTVKGRILLANGKPLTRGRVTFVAADGLKPPASGEIGSGGEFTLSTRDPGDGAAPGEYKVRIEPAGVKARSGRASRVGFPLRYIDEDSSGLAVTVRAEPNQLEPITLR